MVEILTGLASQSDHPSAREAFYNFCFTMLTALISICAAVSVPYLRKGPLTPLGFHLFLPGMTVTAFLTRSKLF